MTAENRRHNAAAEVRRGEEALSAARHLLDGGFFNDAVSRAYYAAFHWARALLLRKGVQTKSHRGLAQMFSLHFVKDGPLNPEIAARLAHLETFRELSDYDSSARFDEKEAREEVNRAESFIAACRPLIENGSD